MFTMKPNFALSLSFKGIRFLHRAAGGWRIVGDVALDSADMAGELAMLRRTATSLEPSGLRTKLLLPNGQIKYLTIDTVDMDDGARMDAARAALDGATPYQVADLAFDISADGNKTHIAAVAKETLIEAEGFAAEHRFNPICFAATPDENPYLGEPYFGPSLAAKALLLPGEDIENDGIAVVVIGDIEPVVQDAAPDEDADNPAEETDDPADDAPEQPAPDTGLETPQISEPDTAPAEPPTAPMLPSLGPARVPTPAPTVPPAVGSGFASRRNAAPASGPQRREPTVAAPRRPSENAAPAAPAIDTPANDVTAASAPALPDLPARPDLPVPTPAPLVAAAKLTAPVTPPKTDGFLSRRQGKPAAAAAISPAIATAGMASPTSSEAERMTVFGARRSDVGGKPRFLALFLTVALLVLLAGVAAWASVFLDDGLNLSRLFGDRAPRETVAAPATSEDTEAAILTAALDPQLTEEDTAVLDALSEPVPPIIVAPPTDQELQAIYATTGIWPRAPEVPPEPAGLINLDDLYLTSIDPVSTANDAVALPTLASFATDQPMGTLVSPAAAGTSFALDARGLIIPTARGALSPDGFTAFLGRPPAVPPEILTRFQAVPEDTGARPELAGFRPKTRPGDLAETNQRATLDGLTRNELATFRPNLRPKSLQEQAEAAAAVAVAAENPIDTDEAVQAALAAPVEASPFVDATRLAIKASARPDTRPRNFERIVKRAQRTPQPQAETLVASTTTVAPRTVAPKIPSKTSVARQATVKNAINLRKVNLIGVYGKPSSRRALVRLSNGRYKKVTVGDRIDGGRVSAIGDSELRYTKGGRNVVLKMPR